MENVVNFEQAKATDLITKFREEKKKNSTDAVSSLRYEVQKFGATVKTLEEYKKLLRMAFPIKQVHPQYYEVDLNNMLVTISANTSIKAKDLKLQGRRFEVEISEELGFTEDTKSAVEINMLQDRYVMYCEDNKTLFIDLRGLLPDMHMSQFLTTWSKHLVHDSGKDITTGEYVIKYALIRQISRYVCDPTKPHPIYADPDQDDFIHYNTFRGWPHSDIRVDNCEKQIKLWLNHTYEVIGYGIKQRYEDLLNYWAHARQHPEQTPEIAIVIYSDEGTGKDAWLKGIRSIFHPAHVGAITGTTFQNTKWTEWAKDKIFIPISELSRIRREDVMNHLKGLITNPEVEITRKGRDTAHTDANYLRICISTNSLEVLPLHSHSRRFALFHVNEKYRGHQKYFADLFTELNNPLFPAALSQFLLERDIKDWHPRKMDLNTPELMNMSKASRDALEILKDAILIDGFLPSPFAAMSVQYMNEDISTSITHSHLCDVYQYVWDRLQKERHPNPGPSLHNFGPAFRKIMKLTENEYKNVRVGGLVAKTYIFPSLKELRRRHGIIGPPE